MASRTPPPRVFDQFTFFSLLIPGIFAFAVTIPLAPVGLFSRNLAGAVVLLLSFSFVVGAIMNVYSELITKKLPFMRYSATVFHQLVVGRYLTIEDRYISQNEDMIVQKCIQELTEIGIVNDRRREEFTRHDTGAMYQYILNKGWRTGGSLPKLHLTIRMMARSLSIISILVIVGSIVTVSLNNLSALKYSPVYKEVFQSDFLFLTLYSIILGTISIGSAYAQKRYSMYFIFYAMTEFIEQI